MRDMSDTFLPQETHSFKAAEIEKVPNEGGLFVIFTIMDERLLAIRATPDLKQALLDALPPLGPDVGLSLRLAKEPENLYFAFRLVPDAKERETLETKLIASFQPEYNP